MIGSVAPVTNVQAASSVKITSIKNTKNGIVLKWKNSKKAAGYKIYRSEDGGKFSSIDITNKSTTHLTTSSPVIIKSVFRHGYVTPQRQNHLSWF